MVQLQNSIFNDYNNFLIIDFSSLLFFCLVDNLNLTLKINKKST